MHEIGFITVKNSCREILGGGIDRLDVGIIRARYINKSTGGRKIGIK